MSSESLISLSQISIYELIRRRAKLVTDKIHRGEIFDREALNNKLYLYSKIEDNRTTLYGKKTISEYINSGLIFNSLRSKTDVIERDLKDIHERNAEYENYDFQLKYTNHKDLNIKNEAKFDHVFGRRSQESILISNKIENNRITEDKNKISNKVIGLWSSIQDNIENIISPE